MRREEIFFDAITNIREELVEEAQRYVFRKKPAVWRRYASLAACVVLIAAISFGIYGLTNVRKGNSMVSTDAGGSENQYSGTASGGDSDAPSGDSDEAAPQDAPAAPPVPGVGADDGVDTPEAVEPLAQQLTAVVLEVHETYLLVSGEEEVRIQLPTEGLEDLPEFREGDVVGFFYEELTPLDGMTAASGVTDIWVVEPAPDAP